MTAPESGRVEEVGNRPALTTCPTCRSTQPHLHPSRDLCPDPFHRPVPTTITEWRREAARWADVLDSIRPEDRAALRPAVDRLVAEIRREVRDSAPAVAAAGHHTADCESGSAAHRCELPAPGGTARHTCECGRRWIAVFVVLVGYCWYPEGQVRFP